MHARNPADADPCVAKCETLADLNQYKTFCLVACFCTGMVPIMLPTETASFSAYAW